MQIFHRTKAFSQLDLDQLTQETWWCLAAGCKECQALELFGLCYLELFWWTCELFFPQLTFLFWGRGIFATKQGGGCWVPRPFWIKPLELMKDPLSIGTTDDPLWKSPIFFFDRDGYIWWIMEKPFFFCFLFSGHLVESWFLVSISAMKKNRPISISL